MTSQEWILHIEQHDLSFCATFCPLQLIFVQSVNANNKKPWANKKAQGRPAWWNINLFLFSFTGQKEKPFFVIHKTHWCCEKLD